MAKRSKKKKKNKLLFNKKRKEKKKQQKTTLAEKEVVQPSLDEMIEDREELVEDIKEEVSEKKSEKSKKKKEKTKPRKGLGEELIEVYEAAGDDLTSVTTLEHRRRSWQRMLVWILGFLVAVFIGVAGVSWWIWGGQQTFNGEQVQFEISTIQEAHSGDAVEYVISYANQEEVGFRKSELELRYPAGFIFESSDPEPTNGENLWDLGSLSSFAKEEITVKGRLVGIPEEDTTLSGVFRYWPANFSSEFQEVAAVQTLIKPVDLGFRVDGPDQVLVGQTTSYSVVLTNKTEEDIKDIRIEAIYPQEFVVEESVPVLANEDDNYWDIELVSAGEELEIQIDGFFSTSSEESTQFIFNLQQKGADEDDYFQQKEERLDTTLVEGDLVVNIIANGSTKNSNVQWGDVINASLSYQNSSEADLADLTALVTIQTRYRTEKP